MTVRTRFAAWLAAAALLSTGAAAHRALARPAGGSIEAGFDPTPGARIPGDLVLLDEASRPVAISEFFGAGPLLLFFTYYRCENLCPMLRDNLASILTDRRLAGRPLPVLLVSVDASDTPADAHREEERFRGRHDSMEHAGWRFLRGEGGSAERLARIVGIRAIPDPLGGLQHSLGLAVVSPEGVVCGYLPGVATPPATLAAALRRAEAGEFCDAPRTAAENVCRPYVEGRSRTARWVLKAVRFSGAATALFVGGALWLLLRRESARSRAASRRAER